MHRTFAALSLVAIAAACQPATAEIKCPADVDGDFLVNITDLVGVISAWGPCSGSPCFGDTNSNGLVDIDDLLKVLDGWGACTLVFNLDPPPENAGSSSAERNEIDEEPESNMYCTYRIDAVAPGSNGVAPGQVICIHCPITWMNACPNLANATFNGVPGAPGASSAGVNATSIGNGFCQACPHIAGAFRYR